MNSDNNEDQAALIGITAKKEDDFADWYQQVILKGKMINFTDISGCYILKPASYAVWEHIRNWLDPRIKSMGVENCYFPCFISEDNLRREKNHIEGFAAEVAWVTHGGRSRLAKQIAVRPTSETAMYSEFAKEIRSHRDLPLKLNQWNNVVRWEFKHPIPFLRSREFLWQEGHTAYLTKEEADKEVLQVLDWYAGIYEELLAVPMVKGRKTVNEQFPGADYTTTVEGFIAANGRGIQGATSHSLGQHFSKMFDIKVEDPKVKDGNGEHLYVWQNSWGFSTRSIGIMIMTHGDDRGLVIPPKVAQIQAVIVPAGITSKLEPEARAQIEKHIDSIEEVVKTAGVRVHVDNREGYSAPWKFNDWEMKGIPLRIEVGPRDLEQNVVTISRRDREGRDGKSCMPITNLGIGIPALLEEIQANLFRKADDEYRAHRKQITKWEDFVPALNAKNVCLIPHCEGSACEDEIRWPRAETDQEIMDAGDPAMPGMSAKSLCIPFDQPSGIVKGETKCMSPKCDAFAKSWVMFGRSY